MSRIAMRHNIYFEVSPASVLGVLLAVIKVNGSVDMAGDLHGVAGLAY